MSNVLKLETQIDEQKAEVVRLLDETRSLDYETVLVVGIREGVVYFNGSSNADRYKLIGLLEFAKQELFEAE